MILPLASRHPGDYYLLADCWKAAVLGLLQNIRQSLDSQQWWLLVLQARSKHFQFLPVSGDAVLSGYCCREPI